MNNIAQKDNMHNMFWRFIESYLPNYSSRDDVLWDDILTRFLEDDDVCEEDMAWISKEFNCDKKLVKEELIRMETCFAQEALVAFYQTYSYLSDN
jgi:hypothetical protein